MNTCIMDTRVMDTMDTHMMIHASETLRLKNWLWSPLRGSHGLSARRARRTKSRGPKGLHLEVGARRAP